MEISQFKDIVETRIDGVRKKIIKNNKEKTIQQQKGLPTLSADLNERTLARNSNNKIM